MTNPPIHNRKVRRVWADRHERRCAFCWVRSAPWPGMAVHHLIKRSRADEPTNLLWTCSCCHQAAHGLSVPDGRPPLSLGAQLHVKMYTDVDEYLPQRLAELLHESLPEPEGLPSWYLMERAKNERYLVLPF